MNEKEKYQTLTKVIREIALSRGWFDLLNINTRIGYSLKGDKVGYYVTKDVLNSYVRIDIENSLKYNSKVINEQNIQWLLEVIRSRMFLTDQYKLYQNSNIVFGRRIDALNNELKLYQL